MCELTLENRNGDRLTFGMQSPFQITEFQGLNPASATINTSEVAFIDGEKFNSAKLNVRTINIAFAITIEPDKNRIEIYKVLKPKQTVKVTYKNDYRDVWIEGYVQKVDISYFAKTQVCTCTILCPDPFLREAQQIVDEMSSITPMFHFPFHSTASKDIVFGEIEIGGGITVHNGGDVETGLIIELHARKAVSDPKVINYGTNEYIGLKFDMEAGDVITINTSPGNKTVTLFRDGVESNIFNSVTSGSTWLQLSAAGETFVYEVGTGDPVDLLVTFKHDNLFEGV